MEDQEGKILSAKFNTVISLLIDLKESLSEKMTMKEKVAYLVRCGLNDDTDMAKMLGTTRGHVAKEKAVLKKDE